MASLFRKSPAPTSSASDTATWATIRARLSRERDSVTLRFCSLSAPDGSARVARRAGTRLNTTPAARLSPPAKAKTRQSNGFVWPNGNRRRAAQATGKASIPPAAERSRLSVTRLANQPPARSPNRHADRHFPLA